jgi:hypothetical protein
MEYEYVEHGILIPVRYGVINFLHQEQKFVDNLSDAFLVAR